MIPTSHHVRGHASRSLGMLPEGTGEKRPSEIWEPLESGWEEGVFWKRCLYEGVHVLENLEILEIPEHPRVSRSWLPEISFKKKGGQERAQTLSGHHTRKLILHGCKSRSAPVHSGVALEQNSLRGELLRNRQTRFAASPDHFSELPRF